MPGDGPDIFIYPGYRFRAVDALITNFHLPVRRLLMLRERLCLTSANIGRLPGSGEPKEYRFFSFGDAMLIM